MRARKLKSDGFVQTGSVGAVANPNIVAGMDASYSDGVYKSIDAGKTWTNVGLKATRSITRVRIDPKNPDLVYVAALGDPWGPSPIAAFTARKTAAAPGKKFSIAANRPARRSRL